MKCVPPVWPPVYPRGIHWETWEFSPRLRSLVCPASWSLGGRVRWSGWRDCSERNCSVGPGHSTAARASSIFLSLERNIINYSSYTSHLTSHQTSHLTSHTSHHTRPRTSHLTFISYTISSYLTHHTLHFTLYTLHLTPHVSYFSHITFTHHILHLTPYTSLYSTPYDSSDLRPHTIDCTDLVGKTPTWGSVRIPSRPPVGAESRCCRRGFPSSSSRALWKTRGGEETGRF